MFDTYLLNTKMTILVFSITIFESIVLLLQAMYYMLRPSDKKRQWYLLFLVLIVTYNLTGGFFTDPRIEWISVKMQNMITFTLGALLSMYFSFYIHKAFDLHYLRWFATRGAIYFILLPLIVTFIIPYAITNDLALYSKIVVIIPSLYGMVWVYLIYKAFIKEFAQMKDQRLQSAKKKEMIAVYIALAFWMIMPTSTFFNVDNQLLQQGMANIGFLIMSISYFGFQINQTRYEYNTSISALSQAQKKLTENAIKFERIDDFLNKFKNLMSEVHFKDREIFSPMISFVNEDWDIKAEMKHFEQHFEMVYSDFFTLLSQNFPDLNQKEKKYLTYMKIGLSNKESCALLGSSLDSLKSYRYRMKKKLFLDPGTTLEDFITSL